MKPVLPAFLAAVAFGTAVGGATADAARCAALLDTTLAAMEARAPLKDELATALMWLRLDAQEALADGDADTCLGLAHQAAMLLQIGDHD